MKTCQNCGHRTEEDQCPRCGTTIIMSVPADSFDSMIQQASTPTLADLFRKAKASGALQPGGQEYGG